MRVPPTANRVQPCRDYRNGPAGINKMSRKTPPLEVLLLHLRRVVLALCPCWFPFTFNGSHQPRGVSLLAPAPGADTNRKDFQHTVLVGRWLKDASQPHVNNPFTNVRRAKQRPRHRRELVIGIPLGKNISAWFVFQHVTNPSSSYCAAKFQRLGRSGSGMPAPATTAPTNGYLLEVSRWRRRRA